MSTKSRESNIGGRPTFGYAVPVSPTIFRDRGFRFYFFSREEPRLHVHVQCANGEAKFWLEPLICLAHNRGLSARELRAAQWLIEEHIHEIRRAWARHFSG